MRACSWQKGSLEVRAARRVIIFSLRSSLRPAPATRDFRRRRGATDRAGARLNGQRYARLDGDDPRLPNRLDI